MEHTKGKWEQNEVTPWEIWMGADKHIASVHGVQEIRSANAQRIVITVNAHDKLTETCKELAEIFPEYSMSELDASDFKDRANRIWAVAKQAERLISKEVTQ